MQTQLDRRGELRDEKLERLQERRSTVVSDAARITAAAPSQGIATVRVSMGTVTLYGE